MKSYSDFFTPSERGVQHGSLRAANRRAVLTTITFNPGISNAGVARQTGLAPQTASAIVAELEADGLVSRGEVLRGRRGQPATPLYLDYESVYGIGCEVSWQHIDIVLMNIGSQELGRYRRHFAYPDPEAIVEEAGTAVRDLMQRLDAGQRSRLIGLGLAMPTSFERHLDLLGAPEGSAARWQALDLRAALAAETGLETLRHNDGHAASWAHLSMHAPPRPSNFAYLFIGSFIGAGIIADHTLWQGPTGNSGDLGSMLVTCPDDRREYGHLLASTFALSRRLAVAGIAPPSGHPEAWPWTDWEPHLSNWLIQAGGALAEIAHNTAAVIEVDKVVIDGVLPGPVMERLLAETRRASLHLPGATGDRPAIVGGALGPRAVSLGAAQLSIYRRLFVGALAPPFG